jgi:sirohydrochlorin cobaltochelatase
MTQRAVLLGTGGQNVAANRRVRTTAAALAVRTDTIPVVPAYVHAGTHGATPSLSDAAERLVAEGADDIAIVPFLLDWPYPEHLDVPDLVRELAEAYPGVRFHLGRTLGPAPEMVDLLAARLDETWQTPDVRDVSQREMAALTNQTPITTAAFRDGAAPNLPPQEQHLLLCAGRRCSELGSADTYRLLSTLLAQRGLEAGPQRIKLTRTKCLGPCAAAPVACVYPRGAYVVGLERDLVPAFVDEVIVGGGTLEGHTFMPDQAVTPLTSTSAAVPPGS